MPPFSQRIMGAAALAYRAISGLGQAYYAPPPQAGDAQRRRLGSSDALTGVTTYYAGPALTPFSTSLGSALTPQAMRAAFGACRNAGLMLQKADIDERLLQNDTHCKAVDHARRVAVTGRPFRSRPANNTDLAASVARFMQVVVDNIDSFDTACYALLQANCSGVKSGEIVWEADRKIRFKLATGQQAELRGWLPRGIQEIHNKHLQFNVATDAAHLNFGGEAQPIRQPEAPPAGAYDFDQFKWIYHVTAGDGQHRLRGYSYAVVPRHLVKEQAFVRMANLLEVWGLPMPIGKIPHEMFQAPEKKRTFLEILVNYGLGQPILTTDDFEIQAPPTPANLDARGMHAALIGMINQEISKVVQGETLTTEVGSVGSYKASETHENTKESIIAQDMVDLANTIRQWLFRAVLLLNLEPLCIALGAAPDEIMAVVPRPFWVISRAMTPEVQMKLLDSAVNGLRLRIDEDSVYDSFGFVKAQPDGSVVRGELFEVSKGAAAVGTTDATPEAHVREEQPVPPRASASPEMPDDQTPEIELTSTDLATVAEAAAAEEGQPVGHLAALSAAHQGSDPGVMIAWYPPPALAERLAVSGGEPATDLHMTLAYLGRRSGLPVALDDIMEKTVATVAALSPLVGRIGGTGRFAASETSDGKDVVYASVDVPGLTLARQTVVEAAEAAGAQVRRDHDFTPHLTLKYVDPTEPSPLQRLGPASIEINELWLVVGADRRRLPLGRSDS